MINKHSFLLYNIQLRYIKQFKCFHSKYFIQQLKYENFCDPKQQSHTKTFIGKDFFLKWLNFSTTFLSFISCSHLNIYKK